MDIVDTTKFAIGIAALVIGLGILWTSRRQRGFGQRRQAGAMLLAAAALFVALGLGVDIRGMLGR